MLRLSNVASLAVLWITAAQGQPQWPTADSEQWYNWTDDGVRHYVMEFGRGGPGDTPIVVLHGGWGAEHSYLIEPLLPLAGRHRFVLYDQRGSLRSPAPESITLDRLVADLEDLRLSLHLERMTLVAHSMGTALAYAYLAAHPNRVRGLVLLGAAHPTLFLGPPNADFIRQVWPEADIEALTRVYDAFMRDVTRRTKAIAQDEGLLPESYRDVEPDAIDWWHVGEDKQRTLAWRIWFTAANSCSGVRWRTMQGGQVFYNEAVANAVVKKDTRYEPATEKFWPALKAFKGPVRIIMGTCDYVDLGPAVWPQLVKHLQNAKLTVLQGSGHMPWMDESEEFGAALSTALREALISPQN